MTENTKLELLVFEALPVVAPPPVVLLDTVALPLDADWLFVLVTASVLLLVTEVFLV